MSNVCVVYTYLGAASTNNLEFMQNANEHLSCGQTRLEIIARMVLPMLDIHIHSIFVACLRKYNLFF